MIDSVNGLAWRNKRQVNIWTNVGLVYWRTKPQQVIFQITCTLQWRHNWLNNVSDDQHHDCLLKRLFRHRTKKTSKLRVTGLCTGNSPQTGEFPEQRTSNAENVSIWWRHHDNTLSICWKAIGYVENATTPSAFKLYQHRLMLGL